MKVPLLDLKLQNAELEDELQQAFTRVLRSGQYILGREVEYLECMLATFVGARYGIGVSSGTDAILLALMALNIGPGDEVICPSFTFFATAGCVARTGATPIFADSCPVCFNIDPTDIERRITARTKALIPVHLFGQAAEMDSIVNIARRHELPILEDAAQALGARYRGRGAGSIGAFGTFSFFPSKNLGGFGDSGLLVTSDESLAARARMLRTHGAESKYYHRSIGGNFRMDPLQAALLAVKLPRLNKYSEARQKNAMYYTEQLRVVPGVRQAYESHSRCLCATPTAAADAGERISVVLPKSYHHNHHIWNQYTIQVIPGPRWDQPATPRSVLRQYFSAREIGSEIYYPCPMHLQECFAANRATASESLPACEALSQHCLSLPVYPELASSQQDFVVETIREFLGDNM